VNLVTDLATLLEGYRLSCTADGKSPQTTRWYLGKLRIFRRYLEETGGRTGCPPATTRPLVGESSAKAA